MSPDTPRTNKIMFVRISSFDKLLRVSLLVIVFTKFVLDLWIWTAKTPEIKETSHLISSIHSNKLTSAADINPLVRKESHPPVLMVGGSDGSGTRAFVDILKKLGTNVVVEDGITFDVHAGQIQGGWPGLINRLFRPFDRKGFFRTDDDLGQFSNLTSDSNHSSMPSTLAPLVANYDWQPMENDFYGKYEKDTKRVERDIDILLTNWDTRFEQNKRIDRNLNIKHDHSANDVGYAIKAPVSMLALPVFVKSYFSRRQRLAQPPRPLKFLHVIRDGRDVSLSNNQSPVAKFYDLTYPKEIRNHESVQFKFSHPSLQPEKPDNVYARAMQLWNDWNVVVHQWAMNHNINNQAVQRQETDAPVVDYLWMRSEDLLVPGSQKRLDALTALAKFVGSTMTSDELCCLSRQESKDHGKSVHLGEHNGKKDGEERVTKRYGKWHQALENKTELSDFFHTQGAEGLKVFGYHPYRRMDYTDQIGNDQRDWDSSTKSNEILGDFDKNEEEEFDGETPAICEVSLACPLI